MKASEFLKRYERDQKAEKEGGKDPEEDHSLQAQAKERAKHPGHLNAGTPYDWAEIEDYQKELDRMDREGPGGSSEGTPKYVAEGREAEKHKSGEKDNGRE